MNVIALITMGVVVLVLAAVLARAPWKLSFGFWLLAPVATVLVLVLRADVEFDLLLLGKTVSLWVAGVMCTCVPLFRALPRRIGGTLVFLLIAGNIGGSAIWAFENGAWTPLIAAALLIVGIGGWSTAWMSKDPQQPSLRLDLGWAWLLGLGLWVAAVQHDNPDLHPLGRQIITFGVSLTLAALWGQDRWMAIRIHSLGLVFTGSLLFPELYDGPLGTPDLTLPGGAQGLGILATALALVALRRNGGRWLRPMPDPSAVGGGPGGGAGPALGG
ncbi:MAG: hypothetical protein H6739_38550 [Alphaproteobacteria bacterium]|nr:hypothetical protein [Alphaproteobacteria bacterium]